MSIINNCLNAIIILGLPFLLVYGAIHRAIEWLFIKRIPKDISNETAVIVGGAGGLGQLLAAQLAEKGCHVVIADINEFEAEKTVTRLREKFNVKFKAYKVDATKYVEMEQLHEKICKDIGVPTILINSAGIMLMSNPLKPNWEEVKSLVEVNLLANIWANQIFLPKMKLLNKGHIVAINSISAVIPLIYNSSYASTRSAVSTLMNILRLELKYENTNVYTTNALLSVLNTNTELADTFQQSGIQSIMPVVSGEEAVKGIVDAMLVNKNEIVISNLSKLHFFCLSILPTYWRDKILLFVLKNVHNIDLYNPTK